MSAPVITYNKVKDLIRRLLQAEEQLQLGPGDYSGTEIVIGGGGGDTPWLLDLDSGVINPRDNAWDFALGGDTLAAADYAFDVGNNATYRKWLAILYNPAVASPALKLRPTSTLADTTVPMIKIEDENQAEIARWAASGRITLPDAQGVYWSTNASLTRSAANQLSIASQLCFDADTAYFSKAAAGRIGVTGQFYTSGVVGFGAAPATWIACYATLTRTSDAIGYGSVAALTNSYAAANFTSQIWGGIGQALRSGAGVNSTHALAMVGLQGEVYITANTQTITGAAALRGIIFTTSGSARAYTNAYGAYTDVSLASGGSIGTAYNYYAGISSASITTLYGFFMPTSLGTTRYGVYIADTSAVSAFAADVLLAAGKKIYFDGSGAPLLGGDTYISEASANYLLDTVGNVATLGRIAGHVGIPATGRHYYDGVACAGDTYEYEKAVNTFALVAGAVEVYNSTATQTTWNIYLQCNNRFRVGLDRTKSVDGEMDYATATDRFRGQINGSSREFIHMEERDYTDVTATNPTVETTLKTYTVAANSWGTTLGWRLRLSGSAISTGAQITLRLKFGGTTFHTFVLGGLNADFVFFWDIANSGATNTQDSTASGFGGATGFSDHNTGAIDTTANQDITITAQTDTPAGSITLKTVKIEAI